MRYKVGDRIKVLDLDYFIDEVRNKSFIVNKINSHSIHEYEIGIYVFCYGKLQIVYVYPHEVELLCDNTQFIEELV